MGGGSAGVDVDTDVKRIKGERQTAEMKHAARSDIVYIHHQPEDATHYVYCGLRHQ